MDAGCQSRSSSFDEQSTSACVVCRKTFTILAIKSAGYLNHYDKLCCITCRQIIACTVTSFIQGFAISWAVCTLSGKFESKRWLDVKAASEHVSRKQVLTHIERENSDLKLELAESISFFKRKSQRFSKETDRKEMLQEDVDDVTPPVFFEAESVEGEGSFDSFSDSLSVQEDSDSQNEHEEAMSKKASGHKNREKVCQRGVTNRKASVDGIVESKSDEPPASASSTLQVKGKRTLLSNLQENGRKKARVETANEKQYLSPSQSSPRLRSRKVPQKSTVNHSMLSSKKKTSKFYSCTYCSRSFSNQKNLRVHVHLHRTAKTSGDEEVNQQSLACEYCAQTYLSREALKAHIKSKHSGEVSVDCDICGKAQPSSYALSAHKKACHDFSSLCHICGAEFSGRASFEKHLASHVGTKCCFCDICGAGFVHKTSLNNHRIVHLSTKSFQCDICSQMFKVRHLLNRHLLEAHQCGPSLDHRIRGLKKMGVHVDKGAVIRHANSQCVVCGKELLEGKCASHPENSQIVFRCPTCGDVADHIVLFYQHVKWHKGTLLTNRRIRSLCRGISRGLNRSALGSDGINSSRAVCEVCCKTFKTFPGLYAHMHQHREARFTCDICCKRFTYKCNLKTHMNSHLDTWQFECEVCQMKFKDKNAYKKHQLKHIEPQFKCDVCGKGLTRRPYLYKHYKKMHPEYELGKE